MSRKFIQSRARFAALALGVGIAGSLATAPASLAAGAKPQPPAIGANCQADGKINGAGSTFQTNGVADALVYGYQQDVCGPQPFSSNLNAAYGGTDPSVYSFGSPVTSVAGMVAYNVSLAGTAESSGSGAGVNRMNCRTDFFGGTDLPYNTTQLTNDQSAPGTGVTCSTALNTAAVPPPYGPQTTVGYPNTNDASAKMMGLPIAAGAVAIAVNLNNGTAPGGGTVQCTGGAPSSIELTADEFDKIMQGTINQWDDNELVATNPALATDGCSGPITRVVRFDNSGTTAITMFTLYGIDPNSLCAGALNWYQIATSSNNSGQWPTGAGCAEGVGTWGSGQTNNSTAHPGALAPAAVTGGSNGSPTLITTLKATPGGIGYAETGLWGTLPAGDSFASLQTFADEQTAGNGLANANPTNDSNGNAAFVAAGNPGQKSLCQLPAGVPTGSTALAAVGLGSPTWSNTLVGTTPGKQDIAWSGEGSGYPACGLTFDLVYSGVHNETGETAAPAGSIVPATAGCTVAAPAATTANGGNAAGSVTVASVAASYPPSGQINIGGTAFAYTSVTYGAGGTFTGASIPAGIAAGTAVSLASTTVAATATTVGVNGACQSVQGPLQGATNDQLRTLYSYYTYVFSPLGQSASYLPTQTLDPLPASWLSALQAGFQQNF